MTANGLLTMVVFAAATMSGKPTSGNTSFTGWAYADGMWQFPAFARPSTEVLALQADVVRAGCALACPYSTSDEFEAAVIAARRNARIIAARRLRLLAVASAAVVILAIAATML